MHARHVPLFWRLFIPNAAVLSLACVVLVVEPANGRIPALAGGLAVMLLADLVLMRRAFAPLERLTEVMRRVDPLHPGRRIPPIGPGSEVSVLAESFNDMLDRLEAERRDSAARLLAEREDERRLVAQALHDQIGQDLTAIALRSARAAEACAGPCGDEMEALRHAVLGAIDDLRGLARRLRPESLDTLGLAAALAGLLESLERDTGIRIHRDLDRNLPALTPDAEVGIYRTVQESCTNAIRHARPTAIAVVLRGRGRDVEVEISDDGCGIDDDAEAASDGGLRAMRERALTLGADLEITRRDPAPGTVVRMAFEATGP